MATTNYAVSVDGKDVKKIANKQRAIAHADTLHAEDKSRTVVVMTPSGAVVHEKIGVTVQSAPRKATGSRLDLANLEARPNVKGYEFNPADTHGTPTTYNKGCRCVIPVEHEGRTIAGCLGAMNEYDRWWRAASAAKKANQPVPERPTFPAVPRARKATEPAVKGKDRADALIERMAAKTSGKSAAAG